MTRPRRVRGMIMRTFIGAMVTSFAVFTMLVVVLVFMVEDEIFELQVKEAADRFPAQAMEQVDAQGTINSLEMTYYRGTDAMPQWLRSEIDQSWPDGPFEVFGEERGHFHGHVRTLPDGEKLYVLFNARRFIRSTPQIITFLKLVGTMALLGLLTALFFLARMSGRVSGPLEGMAATLADGESVVGRLDVPEKAPRELQALARAIEERDARIQILLERERQFNRDASHELRTPLTVASGAAELLEEKDGGSRALTRLKAAIKDMQQLTEGILWLGREPDPAQACDGSAICADSIRAYGHLVGDRDVAIRLEGGEGAAMPVPEPVALVMVGNILRNALAYTDAGEVLLRAGDKRLDIIDTGVGFGAADEARQGFGVGLTLVERLADHFGITFSVTAREEGGTIASLSWDSSV